jgi:hypothetical protein
MEPSPEDEGSLIIEEYCSVGSLLRGLEPDLLVYKIHIRNIHAYKLVSPYAVFARRVMTALS